MPYDYYLESENEQRMFKQETWQEMQKYLDNIPHYKVDKNFYYIFRDNSQRDAAIPGIVSKISNNKNIYTHPCIGFSPTSIIISVVGDKDVDRYLYDFVVWCQKRYPCKLYEGSEVISPEELILFEEDYVPSIN